MADKVLAEKPGPNGAMTHADPLGFFDAIQKEFDRFWHDRFFVPRTDMFEKDGTLVVKVELPGMTKEDVEVELDDGDLVIKATRSADKEVKETQYYRMERTYGTFYRRVPLPPEVKPEQISATLTDGVLEVKMPMPAPKPASIKVPVG